MTAVRRLVAVIAVAVQAAACGAGSMGSPLDPASRDGDEIKILVRNRNFNQVTVYTTRGGGSFRRLGTVPGKGETEFAIRWHLPDIQLRITFLAGPEVLTERLPVSPGERLELNIPAR